MIIVDHMDFVKYYDAQIIDSTVLDSGVDQRVCLQQYVSKLGFLAA